MASPINNAKRALERRLSTLTPSVPIAYEAVKFTPPATMYLACMFNVQQPEDPVLGDLYYRERLSFTVLVCDVLNKGTSTAIEKAEQIRALFPKGLVLTETDKIYILSTPQIQGTTITQDRLIVPVTMSIVVEVFRA
jgi:hypothetical protein